MACSQQGCSSRRLVDLDNSPGPRRFRASPRSRCHPASFPAGVGLLLALALWLTSKGLQANANWARVSAFALLLLALLPSLLLALSLQNLPRLLMLLLVAICALGIHALFANQIPQTH